MMTGLFLYRRREFLTLGAAAAFGRPWAVAHAQGQPVIGFLSSGSADVYRERLAGFHSGLRELGYTEGKNVAIEYRWALGDYGQLPGFAAELVRHPVSILVATGGEPAALAAKAVTSTIPTIFAVGSDAIRLGLVRSYNRPGGNATGIDLLITELEAKRLGLLHELAPEATRIGVLMNPDNAPYELQLREVQEAGRSMGVELHVLRANTDRDIETAFETVARERISALAIAAAPFFDNRRAQPLFRCRQEPPYRQCTPSVTSPRMVG